MLRQYLARKYPNEFLVTNASRWGAHSRWAVKHIKSRVLRHMPDVVIFEFAINDADVRNRISVAESEANLESMIELAGESNRDCEIWLMTSHLPTGRHQDLRPGLADFYKLYRPVAERKGIGLIDLDECWHSEPPGHQYMPDGIHTNLLAARKVILPTVLANLKL